MRAFFLFASSLVLPVAAADHLPPLLPWDGPTQALIQPQHPWGTPAELTDLAATPDYAQTISYLKKLVASSPLLRLEVIGKSPQGRDIYLVKASVKPDLVGKSGQPTLLVQAGNLHAVV